MTTAIDPRLKRRAFVERNGVLWENLGKELDETGGVTGKYVLENCKGVRSATGGNGTWLHRTLAVTATTLCRDYRLVRAAPAAEIPAHLDREMEHYLAEQGELAF